MQISLIKHQQNLVQTANVYSPYLQFAVTLTMKKKAKIRTKRFENWDGEYYERWVWLNDEIARSVLRYFNARLTYYVYGKDALKTSTKFHSQPLVIATFEKTKDGRLHIHAAVGNLQTKYTYMAHEWVSKAWADCDFAYRHIRTKKLHDTYGWLDYMAKETSAGNMDAICIECIKQPQSIAKLVGAESSYS